MTLPSDMKDPVNEIRKAVSTGDLSPAAAIRYCLYWIRNTPHIENEDEKDIFEELDREAPLIPVDDYPERENLSPEAIERDKKNLIRLEKALEISDENSRRGKIAYELVSLMNEIKTASGISVPIAASSPPEPPPAPDSTPPLGSIRWKGSKADLGRVYGILGKLIDCTGVEWERHFIGHDGRSMRGATDMHNSAPVSGRPEINALSRATREMETEPD